MTERKRKGMDVQLISVGSEFLIGKTINTNTFYLAERLSSLGYDVKEQIVVGDEVGEIQRALHHAINRVHLVFVIGGLGAMKDDVTKKAVTEALNIPLVENSVVKNQIKNRFQRRKENEIPENVWGQAMTPKGAVLLENKQDIIPGFIISSSGKKVILLPGNPKQLQQMVEQRVMLYLKDWQPSIVASEIVKIMDVTEQDVEEKLGSLLESENPSITTYSKVGEVHLRIIAKTESKKESKKLVAPILEEIKKCFGNCVYSTKENETLEENVVSLLKKHNITVATAESCTGGRLAGKLVNVSGVSDVFRQGFITYSNKAKRKLIGVNKNTLKKYGAVSKQTAKEMAQGVSVTTGADVGIGITGIAGPEGGTQEKPVGLVYIGCYVKEKAIAKEYHFVGERNDVREQSVMAALALLRTMILDNYK